MENLPFEEISRHHSHKQIRTKSAGSWAWLLTFLFSFHQRSHIGCEINSGPGNQIGWEMPIRFRISEHYITLSAASLCPPGSLLPSFSKGMHQRTPSQAFYNKLMATSTKFGNLPLRKQHSPKQIFYWWTGGLRHRAYVINQVRVGREGLETNSKSFRW